MGGPLTITLPQGVNTTNSTAITATLASPDSNPWRWIFSAPEAGVPDPAWEFSRELQVSESFAWPLAPAQSELLVTVTATATAHAFSFPINDGTAGTISILISRASPTG